MINIFFQASNVNTRDAERWLNPWQKYAFVIDSYSNANNFCQYVNLLIVDLE